MLRYARVFRQQRVVGIGRQMPKGHMPLTPSLIEGNGTAAQEVTGGRIKDDVSITTVFVISHEHMRVGRYDSGTTL